MLEVRHDRRLGRTHGVGDDRQRRNHTGDVGKGRVAVEGAAGVVGTRADDEGDSAVGTDSAAGGHDGVAFGAIERAGSARGREGDQPSGAGGQHRVGQPRQCAGIDVAMFVERCHQRDVEPTKFQSATIREP